MSTSILLSHAMARYTFQLRMIKRVLPKVHLHHRPLIVLVMIVDLLDPQFVIQMVHQLVDHPIQLVELFLNKSTDVLHQALNDLVTVSGAPLSLSSAPTYAVSNDVLLETSFHPLNEKQNSPKSFVAGT